MNCTIFADASYSQHSGIGGWGAWAVSNRGSVEHAGAFKKDPPDSFWAETWAIINGVNMALVSEVARPSDFLIIQSDCQAAILLLQRPDFRPRPVTKSKRRSAAEMKELHQLAAEAKGWFNTLTADCRWELRHVKGHSSAQGVRSHRNNQVDGLARAARESAERLRR